MVDGGALELAGDGRRQVSGEGGGSCIEMPIVVQITILGGLNCCFDFVFQIFSMNSSS